MNPLTIEKVSKKNLKQYGLQVGQEVNTSLGTGKIIGLNIVTSEVNSFQFNKGQKLHLAQIELENETVIGEEVTKIWGPLNMPPMYEQVIIDKFGEEAAKKWGFLER